MTLLRHLDDKAELVDSPASHDSTNIKFITGGYRHSNIYRLAATENEH